MHFRYGLIYLVGGLEALLLARLLLRLLAARPDNPALAALFAVSAPWIAPLAFLDAHQPQFGAVLEFSTLALSLLIGSGLFVIACFLRWRKRRQLIERDTQ